MFFNCYVTFNINYASVCLLKHLIFALFFKSQCYLSFRLSLLTVESLTSEHSQMAGGKDREQREENIKHAISPCYFISKTEQDTTSSLTVAWNRGVLGQALILTVLLGQPKVVLRAVYGPFENSLSTAIKSLDLRALLSLCHFL